MEQWCKFGQVSCSRLWKYDEQKRDRLMVLNARTSISTTTVIFRIKILPFHVFLGIRLRFVRFSGT